ncbi:MAG TPA: hypothetical protein PLG15_01295 [Candidatus Gastranaerophilaceae bacterium]|nr:hypothetical protein [Candidatus Gastranaerophilaceae bacterium]HPT41003.1 hypothetical protein [Candidatus Gastranaerophilaceae bacterium]
MTWRVKMISTLNSMSLSSLFCEDGFEKCNTINIKLKASDITDEFISCGNYSSLNSKSIDTLVEYKIAKNLQLTSQNLSTENIDYEAEFKEFLNAKGCSNEKELQALNTTSFKTVGQLRNAVSSIIRTTVSNVLSDDNNLEKYLKDIDNVVSDLSVEELADFFNSPEEAIKKIIDMLKNFIEKYKDDPSMKEKLSRIKELLKKLEKAQEKTDKDKTSQTEENQKNYIKKNIEKYEKIILLY